MSYGRVHADRLRGMVEEIFVSRGVPERHASTVAECLVESDLHGVHSHGSVRTVSYVEDIDSGRIDPHGSPRVEREHGSCLVVDGDNALGPVATAFATEVAGRRARESGVGVAAVHRSNHCSAAGYYARMAQSWGMVGLVFTTTLPAMAVPGARDRVLGLNPWAVAVPGNEEPDFALDTTFGFAARGRLRIHAQDGEAIPDHWALDEHGAPTTDPTEALQGLIRPIGDYKGAGLATAVGLMATVFSGAAFGTDLGDTVAGANEAADGSLVVVIDPAAFGDPQAVRERTDRALSGLRRCSHEEPCAPRLPGDRARQTCESFREHGIRLHESTIASLEELLSSRRS